jgi:uncharacterized protein DUF4276
VTVKLYVEGGGHHNKDLQTQCRRGFTEFLQKAGLADRMPRVVACGARDRAYRDFRISHESAAHDQIPILLVDSEGPVGGKDPWEHVRLRSGDGWQRPQGASADQIHFMVEAMEAWFHADKEKLEEFYKQGFRMASLSQRIEVEHIPKADLFAGMKLATRDCQKGEYSKGEHSFQILALIRPEKVRAASPVHAERLFVVLDRICGL